MTQTYYCSVTDIQNYVSTPTLIQLTNDEGSDKIVAYVVKEAIIYASTLIDGYLRGRYNLPLNTQFPLLKILAIDISVHRLYSRRVRDDMPEVIENAYNKAIQTLRDIQKGILTLEAENDLLETSGFNPEEYKTNKDIIDRIFNKRKMSQF
ncbi:DUF1320 domain-containing protein [bacterium]|nr:DUF1320 domain-containing protein [bacterium]